MSRELSSHPRGSSVIPFRVRVGVTGHRRIPDDAGLDARIREALAAIRALASGTTPTHLAVVSPLAEGADQLVARIALEDDPEAQLEVLLPMSESEYVGRFDSDASRSTFRELADHANRIVQLQREPETPEEAYERVGREVVASSDVVIALWDGQSARGPAGTANVVAHARATEAPLIWIETAPPFAVHEELGAELLGESFRELDRYNTARVPPGDLDTRATQRTKELLAVAASVHLDRPRVEELCSWVMPHYARASLLADGWQARYRHLSNTLFFTAAAAVATVAAQVIFAPEHPRLVAIEACLLVLVLAVLSVSRRLRVHERWISYRVLAERFRSALFLALAGTPPELESASEQARLGPTGQWPRRAFDEVWRVRPRREVPPSFTRSLQGFITRGLIEDQLAYHRGAVAKYRRRQIVLTRAIYALFTLTLLAAVLHALEVVEAGTGGHFTAANLLTFVAIGLPAAAGALAGVEAQRQYDRSVERSSGMAHKLESAREHMLRAPDLESVRAVMYETERILLEESNDWLVTVRFQGIKLAV